MSLFVVRHAHSADRCPAADFATGAGLLNHLSKTNARRHGVRIRGDAVLAAHTLLIIAEADSEDVLREFLRPFEAAGTVSVESASTCAQVVAGGGCEGIAPALDPAVPALDPEEACEEALDAGLVVHRAHPLNCETPLPALMGGVVMPNARFYIRNHFQIPNLDSATWRLEISGLVERPLSLNLAQLRALPSQSAVVTLECAGNGRAGFEPRVPGEQWGVGAVSTAEWTGVLLTEVLERAGVQRAARDVVFRGTDSGEVEARDGLVHFERSLSIDEITTSGPTHVAALDQGTVRTFTITPEEVGFERVTPNFEPRFYGSDSIVNNVSYRNLPQPHTDHLAQTYRCVCDTGSDPEPEEIKKNDTNDECEDGDNCDRDQIKRFHRTKSYRSARKRESLFRHLRQTR